MRAYAARPDSVESEMNEVGNLGFFGTAKILMTVRRGELSGSRHVTLASTHGHQADCEVWARDWAAANPQLRELWASGQVWAVFEAGRLPLRVEGFTD